MHGNSGICERGFQILLLILLEHSVQSMLL